MKCLVGSFLAPTGTEQSETMLTLRRGENTAWRRKGGSRTWQPRLGGRVRQPSSPPVGPPLGEHTQVLPLCAHLHVSYCIRGQPACPRQPDEMELNANLGGAAL